MYNVLYSNKFNMHSANCNSVLHLYPLRFDSIWIRSDQGFVCLTLVGKKVNAAFSRCIIVHRTSL